MAATRKRYTAEFKAEAVRLVEESQGSGPAQLPHISGLFVCRSPTRGTIQRMNRRGQVEIEPIV